MNRPSATIPLKTTVCCWWAERPGRVAVTTSPWLRRPALFRTPLPLVIGPPSVGNHQGGLLPTAHRALPPRVDLALQDHLQRRPGRSPCRPASGCGPIPVPAASGGPRGRASPNPRPDTPGPHQVRESGRLKFRSPFATSGSVPRCRTCCCFPAACCCPRRTKERPGQERPLFGVPPRGWVPRRHFRPRCLLMHSLKPQPPPLGLRHPIAAVPLERPAVDVAGGLRHGATRPASNGGRRVDVRVVEHVGQIPDRLFVSSFALRPQATITWSRLSRCGVAASEGGPAAWVARSFNAQSSRFCRGIVGPWVSRGSRRGSPPTASRPPT